LEAVEAAAQHSAGVDTAALQALPWTIDRLAFDHDDVRISFCLADGLDVLGPSSLCLRTRTRGKRHCATREEAAT
jgi:hypothetical protein